MTTPSTTPTRKLIDVGKILAVLDAEKHLVHGSLVTRIVHMESDGDLVDYGAFVGLMHSEDLPEPGPLAVANCEHVGRCAMGSLLYASGRITYRELADFDGDAREWPLRPVKVLYDTYGLQRFHAHEIIQANDANFGDDETGISERRQRVRDRVHRLALLQNAQPENDLDECRIAEDKAAEWGEDYPTVRERFDALDLGYVDYYGPDPDFS